MTISQAVIDQFLSQEEVKEFVKSNPYYSEMEFKFN